MRSYRPVWVTVSLVMCISLLSSGCGIDLANVKFKDVDQLSQDKADRHQANKDAARSGGASTMDDMDDMDDLNDLMDEDDEMLEMEEQSPIDPLSPARPTSSFAPDKRPALLASSVGPDKRPAPSVDPATQPDRPTFDPPRQPTDAPSVSKAASLAPGTFLATARGLKIQITLLNEGGIKLYMNGQETKKSQSGTSSSAVSSIKWIINGGELEFREPNGTVAFYRIQDKDTFVGPVAKKTAAERQRKVTGANEQQVFTRGAAPASAFREFSDSTGQFKIRAKFIEFRMGKVHLQKDDGKLLTLSMDKLSKPDQQYILTEIKNRQ